MSGVNKKKLSPLWYGAIVVVALIDLALLMKIMMRGKNVALFNPKGLIAQEQLNLMMIIVVVLVVVAIPTLITMFFIAWKYRESNSKTVHNTTTKQGKNLVLVMWTVPSVIILSLGGVMVFYTHKLAPQKSIAADAKPITIQVVSLRWKWLFIYPEQQIASVNFVQVPLNTPIEFDLTSDEAPKSSFWIPNLGGQLYTMTGMVNRLNLIADTPGDYPGNSAEINGIGFAGMKFTARASSNDDFEQWVQKVKQSGEMLDASTYENLIKPSENNPVAYYSSFEPQLYDKVVEKYSQFYMGHNH